MREQRKLRRMAAGLLALCMLAAGCPGYGAEAETSVPTEAGAEALEKLTALGIFDQEGYEGDALMDRGTFTRLVMQLSGDAPAILNPQDRVFADVDAATQDSGYIAAAYRLGYVSGEPEGAFRPREAITADAAVKLTVGMLGYGLYAQETGGFPAGYLKIARRIGLLHGIDLEGETPLTWAHAMLLLDNAAQAELMQISRMGDTVEMRAVPGETLLSQRFSIDQTEAVIDANAYSGLTAADSGLMPGTVSAEGVVYRTGSTGAEAYLGRKMELYYRTETGAVPELLYAVPSGENQALELTAEQVIDMERATLTYEGETGKIRDARLSEDVVLIWNGKMTERTREKVMPECGTVTLLSNDGDALYDVISVMSYTSYVVSAVSPGTYSVGTKQGKTLELDPGADPYDAALLHDGQRVDFAEIQPGQVLSYAESEAVGTALKTVLISTETVSGVIESCNRGDRRVEIDGSVYSFDPMLEESLVPGREGTFYLDAFHRLVYIEGTLDIVYGYLNALKIGVFGEVDCRIFTENNRWVTLRMNNRVRSDGESLTAAEIVQRLAAKEGYRQMIRYLVDPQGNISRMDIAKSFTLGTADNKQAEADDRFRMTASGNLAYRTTNNTFDGVVTVEDDAKIFVVNGTDEEDISLIGRGALEQDQSYEVEAYDTDQYRGSRVFLVKNYVQAINTRSALAKMMLVTGLGSTLNNEMEPREAVAGYYAGTEVVLPVNLGPDSAVQNLSELHPGDLIQFKLNSQEEMENIVRQHEAGTAFSLSSSTAYHAQSFVTGKVLTVDAAGNRLILQYAEEGGSAVYSTRGINGIYIYESDSGTCERGTMADVMTGDTVVAAARYLVCREMFIIR